jgi:hypothetical protein
MKITGSTYAKKEAQYIRLLQLESFHQVTGPLHYVSVTKAQITYNSSHLLIFTTNLDYIKKMKYINEGVAWATLFPTAELSKNRKLNGMHHRLFTWSFPKMDNNHVGLHTAVHKFSMRICSLDRF